MSIALAAPDRSLQQSLDALARANAIRTRRAVLKRDLKAGRTTATVILLDPPTWAQTMRVHDLLLAIPKVGRSKAAKALHRCSITPSKTLGDMSPRQRTALAGEVGAR